LFELFEVWLLLKVYRLMNLKKYNHYKKLLLIVIIQFCDDVIIINTKRIKEGLYKEFRYYNFKIITKNKIFILNNLRFFS
jgi:hypothetical protein